MPMTVDLDRFLHELQHTPQSQEALTQLQQQKIQTTLILFLLWLGRSGHGKLTRRDLTALYQASQSWHNGVVRSLTHLTDTLNRAELNTDLPQEAQKLSDFAFQAELNMLKDTFAQRATPCTSKQQLPSCCANLTRLLKLTALSINDDIKHALSSLLASCYPDCPPMEINQQLDQSFTHAKLAINHHVQLTLVD